MTRDIPQLGISIPLAALRRFWTMLAQYHGQTWNASEPARSLDLSEKKASWSAFNIAVSALKFLYTVSLEKDWAFKKIPYAKAQWLEARMAELLSTSYYHVVFTVPEETASVAFQNRIHSP